MSIAVSKDSLSNRRLYLKNRRTLISFSEEGQLERVTLDQNLCEKSIEALKPDLVSIGDHALRLKAADALGKLISIHIKVDPLFTELLNILFRGVVAGQLPRGVARRNLVQAEDDEHARDREKDKVTGNTENDRRNDS